jgi:hypothetical protein
MEPLVHMHEGQSYDIPECVYPAVNLRMLGMIIGTECCLISSNYKHLTNYMQTSPLLTIYTDIC